MSQLTQVWLRIVLGVVFSCYIYWHGEYFDVLFMVFAISILAYQLLNLISFYWIRRQPYSLLRLLLTPAADCYLILVAMWADGGHMSVAYVLLLSPIFGNGFRYGLFMLRYCQALAIFTLLAVCLINVYSLHIAVDWLGLAAELIGILYISFYGYSLIKHNESTSQAKRQAEESASRLIAEMPQPAFTYHIDAQDAPILYANPAMFILTAEKPASLIGMPIAQLVIEEDRPSLLDAALHRKSDATQQCYVRLPAPDGEHVQVMCELRRTWQSGQEIGLAYLTDISQSERLQGELAEAQKQAHSAALAAGVAHDFRNLLSGIIGYAELIQMDYDDPQLQHDIARIIQSGQQGSEMVEQLLLLGRSKQADRKLLQVGPSIRRMVQLFRVQLPADIELSIHVAENLPLVHVNIAQLEQVLLNLVSNAAQSMPAQRGRIEIQLSRLEGPDDQLSLCISVRDNGCGISTEYLTSVFKPFWSTRKDAGGTGLGLAMVQRIMRWHQGSIDVESVLGEGTVFHLRVPAFVEGDATEPLAGARPSDADETGEDVEAEVLSALPRDEVIPWHILLIEDQPDVMNIHHSFLSKMGHHVHRAENGEIALQMLDGQDFDMVLTDYMMPGMDGVALTQAIRQRCVNMPVTLATAYSEDEALLAIHHPNTYVMSKPVSFQQLSRHILLLQQGLRVPTA